MQIGNLELPKYTQCTRKFIECPGIEEWMILREETKQKERIKFSHPSFYFREKSNFINRKIQRKERHRFSIA